MNLNYPQYLANVQSPLQRFLESRQLAMGLRANEAQQQAAIEQQERVQRMNSDLAQLATNGQASPQDYAIMMTQYPELQEHLTATYNFLNDAQKTNKKRDALELFSALDSDRLEYARDLIDNRLEGARNTGDQNEIQSLENMRHLIDINPLAARASSGLFLSAVMDEDDFADTFSKLQSERRDRNKEGFDLRKLAADVRKSELEYQRALENDSSLAPEKKFDLEKSVRNEYGSLTQTYRLVEDAYRRLESLEPSAGGVYDLAAIYDFIKMLDPRGAVKQGEFEAVDQTRSIVGSYLQKLENLTGDRARLASTPIVNDIKRVASKFYDLASERERNIRQGLQRVATEYGLDSSLIFFEDTMPERQQSYERYQAQRATPSTDEDFLRSLSEVYQNNP